MKNDVSFCVYFLFQYCYGTVLLNEIEIAVVNYSSWFVLKPWIPLLESKSEMILGEAEWIHLSFFRQKKKKKSWNTVLIYGEKISLLFD